jgi:hypothetical protein
MIEIGIAWTEREKGKKKVMMTHGMDWEGA